MARNHSVLTDIMAGGIAGSIGAAVTSPLDVIQTRLQSSAFRIKQLASTKVTNLEVISCSKINSKVSLYSYGKQMVKSEGISSLFKGLTPTLIAVTPSRAIYFSTYKCVKDFLNSKPSNISSNSTSVYMIAGASAQFANSTITNPLWFLKTRLQLDFNHNQKASIFKTICQAYNENGIKTFYLGLRASYFGMIEAAVNFACYEKIKSFLKALQEKPDYSFSVVECTFASATAKFISTFIGYPYEVIRTRQRQQWSQALGEQRYQTCIQTLKTILREERVQGLYGGMATSLIRQVPYFAMMFSIYEGIVYLFIKDKD